MGDFNWLAALDREIELDEVRLVSLTCALFRFGCLGSQSAIAGSTCFACVRGGGVRVCAFRAVARLDVVEHVPSWRRRVLDMRGV